MHPNLGVVATLGLGHGAFQYRRIVVRGSPAWVMLRGYHVWRSPTWERKIRVLPFGSRPASSGVTSSPHRACSPRATPTFAAAFRPTRPARRRDRTLASTASKRALGGATRGQRVRTLETEVAAGGDRERLHGADVVLDEGLEVAVAGLGGDAVQGHAGGCRGGGVPGA